jgi:hypothetical protein
VPEKNQFSYKVADHYALRTPLLSYSACKKFVNKVALNPQDYVDMVSDRLFREALYLASPVVYAQLVKWEQSILTDTLKIERLMQTLFKYAIRISTRCTPFGLFAACAAGSFKEETAILLENTKDFNRITRFDTTFLNQLAQVLAQEPVLQEQLLYYPNTTLYKIASHYRYVSYRISDDKRAFALEGVTNTPAIDLVLTHAQQGLSIYKLASLLVDDDTSIKDALYFISQLINCQLLVSSLELTVTGADYFKTLLGNIPQTTATSGLHKQLQQLDNALSVLDTTLGNEPSAYDAIAAQAKNLVPLLNKKYLFQTDCFATTTTNTLNSSLKKDLQEVFTVFNKMTLPSAHAPLEDFKTAFTKRYEHAWIPLAIVLDTETGLGYGTKKEDNNPLLEDIPLGNNTIKRYQRVVWTDVDSRLLKQLEELRSVKGYELELTPLLFKDVPAPSDDLPSTLAAMIEVYDELIYINSASGSSAVNLLGRFCHGDQQLLDHAKGLTQLELELQPDAILAEIVHVPEARTGNILQRPQLRAYEIPYMGQSSVNPAHQLPLSDLIVTVKNDRVCLHSIKLDKEIIPRLSNAHNYGASSIPMYSFLCDLQTQNTRSWIGFSWNPIFNEQVFMPRVRYKQFIFSKARWRIETVTFKKRITKTATMAVITSWQQELQLPDLVELVQGDNKLLINLKNTTARTLLIDTIKHSTHFILEEFLEPSPTVVRDAAAQPYCNQFVVAFCKTPVAV